MKTMLLLGSCAVALMASPAVAQQTPASGPPGPGTGGETTAVPPTGGTQTVTADDAAASQTGAQEGLQDIIVTATRVETSVQKTPIAISTLSGEQLLRAGVTNAQDLNKLVPGVAVQQTGPGTALFIRGVGSLVLNSLADPAIAFGVDGVYYSRSTGPSETLFDVARLEVVKGPQGTLYGRNATGGAFNVITNRPDLDHRGLDLTLEAGNYSAVRAAAAINLPVSDTFAIRIAGQNVYHDGYYNDGYSDQNTKAARFSALWKPTDGASLFFSADYAHAGGQGPGTVAVGPDATKGIGRYVVPGDPWVGISDPRANAFLHRAAPASAIAVTPFGVLCPGAPLGPNVPGTPAIPLCSYPLGVSDALPDGFVDNDYFGGNLTGEADLGFATLTAIGGYRGTRVNSRFYIGPAVQEEQSRSNLYTAEARLASTRPDSILKWIIGGYYSRENQSTFSYHNANNLAVPTPVAVPGSPLPASTCFAPLGPICLTRATTIESSFNIDIPDITDESIAGFGQATLSLTHWLRATGGIRYTHERKEAENGTISQFYTVPAGVTVSYPTRGTTSFNDTSYRAGFEADLAPRSMLYASISTAFHAGGINQGVPEGPNRFFYDPEKVKSYVVGIKNRFFDNRVQFNVEAFWLDYDNYQVNGLGRINDGSFACSTLNIATACSTSLRTDNAARARTRGIETDLLIDVTHGGTFSANVLYNEARFREFRQINSVTGQSADYGGHRLPGAPDWSVTAAYNQRFDLGNGGAITAEARSQYKSGYAVYYIYVPGNYQKAATRTDLSLGYILPGNRLSVTAFLRNVENKATLQQGYNPNAETGVPYNTFNAPRTFGVTLSYHG